MYEKIKTNHELSRIGLTHFAHTRFYYKIIRFCTFTINRICSLCKNGVEDEYHFIILCSSLNNIRNKIFANILSIFPSFHVLTDEKKFLHVFQCEEYDIVKIIVRGVNEMYNRRNELIDN